MYMKGEVSTVLYLITIFVFLYMKGDVSTVLYLITIFVFLYKRVKYQLSYGTGKTTQNQSTHTMLGIKLKKKNCKM